MPAAKPPEFRRRAVELARLRERPVAQIAKDLQISESCLRRWMDQSDVDEGHKPGLSTDEGKELVRLRRENRVQAMEIEILKRASAYFARENVLPNRIPARPRARRAGHPCCGDVPGPEGVPIGLLRLGVPPPVCP